MSSTAPPSPPCRNPSNLPQSCRVISRWSQLHSANTAKGDASMKMMDVTAEGAGNGDQMKDDGGEGEEKKAPAIILPSSSPAAASPEYDQFLPHSSMIICNCTSCCPCEMHTRLRKGHANYQHLLQRLEKQINNQAQPKKRKSSEPTGSNGAEETKEERRNDGNVEEKTAPSPLKKQKKNNQRKFAASISATSSSPAISSPPSSTTPDLLCVKTYSDLHGRFELFQQIGSGTFSCVFQARIREDCVENREILARHPTSIAAVKRFLISSHPHRLYTEQEFLQRYGCIEKHILPMLGMHQVIGAPSVLILPYFEHQDFRSHYTRLSLHTIQTYLKGLLTSIAYLADNKIMHRDIKPDNFLFDFERARKEEMGEVERRKVGDIKMKNEVETSASSATASSSSASFASILTSTGIPSTLNGFLVDFGLSHTELQLRPELLLEREKKQQQQQQELAVDLLAIAEHKTLEKQQQEESKSMEQQPVEIKEEGDEEEDERKSTSMTTKSSNKKTNTKKNNKKKSTSTLTQDASTARCAGTRGYRAPEILASCVTQTCAIDVWSVGSILAAMLTWKYPFFSGDEEVGLAEVMHVCGDATMREKDAQSQKLIEKVQIWEQLITFERAEKEKEFVWEEYSRFSTSLLFPSEFFSLLRGLLMIDPQRRLTASQALEHPLFQKDYIGVKIESTTSVKHEKKKQEKTEEGERKENGIKSEK